MLRFAEIFSYIFIVGAAQGFILSIFLFKKKENQTANRLIAILMILFGIDLLAGSTYLTGYIKYFPWLSGLNNSLPYLYGPFVYLYVKILVENDDRFHPVYYLHFLPFVLIQIYAFFFFYFESAAYQLSMFDNSIPNPWHIELIGKAIPFHGCIYLIMTIKESLVYNKKLKQSFSNIDQINLKWLRYLIGGTFIVWLVVFLSYIVNFIYGEDLQANMLIYVVLSIFLYSLGIKTLKQPMVHFENGVRKNSSYEPQYKKSGLADEEAEALKEKLILLMEEEKPYLNNKISLNDLSNMIDISPHNLSEIINRKLDQNFYDFINSYRIQEVIEMLEEDRYPNYSLLALGYEAGFSSKSAYYSAFKKITGDTPAQYKDKLKNN